MNKILVLGAGRSSTSLINYLLKIAEPRKWVITVADVSRETALLKIGGSPFGRAMSFDVNNHEDRRRLIETHDIVISLMPPPFHFQVAKTCIEFSKHLLTASYVSPEIAELHQEATKRNVLILMETGLDPGIDHMSAMVELEKINQRKGKLISFKSFTGGLITPESDNNPWHYKITWNPRNVVLAGKGISKYLEQGVIKELDYKKLFSSLEEISVEGYGKFEGYPNRDSLKYLETYQLNDVSTFLRGTLRYPGYCSAWNVLVQAGYTDDSLQITDSENLTVREVTERLLKKLVGKNAEEKFLSLGTAKDLEKIKWLGLLDNTKVILKNASPADILQKQMEEKWRLMPGDKDMIVMQHQFEFSLDGSMKRLVSSLVVKGEDELETAMAKTVGLPLGIAAKLVMEGKIKLRGVQIPVVKEIYEPVLEELETYNVKFHNEETTIQ